MANSSLMRNSDVKEEVYIQNKNSFQAHLTASMSTMVALRHTLYKIHITSPLLMFTAL